MILRKAIEACANDTDFKDCSECACSEDIEECFDWISTYVRPEKCNYCMERVYHYNDSELEEINPNYCVMCGRSLRV